MALSSRAYVRVPPDGAGKALMTDNLRHIEYTNAVPNPFQVGNVITGASSALAATVLHVIPETATTGAIGVSVAFGDIDQDFEVGEDLLVDGQVRARVSSREIVYVSKSEVVGANNPQYGQSVDVEGAAFVRFPGGAPNLDATGRTEVTERNWIGSYGLTYDAMPELIATEAVGGGTEEYQTDPSTVVMRVDAADGSSVVRRTHLYHKYIPGVAQVADLAVTVGAPKAGVCKRWGYFDESDGVFFEQDGLDLFIVVRSSDSGTVVERRIPRSEWNGDRLDGSGDTANNPSGLMFDPTKFYLFNIAFLYLGAGPIRLSVNVGGARVVLHVVLNAGESARPWMRTGSLPLRWEIKNTSATGSNDEFRVGNSSVSCEGPFDPPRRKFGNSQQIPSFTVNSTDWTTLLLARPKTTFRGITNRVIVIPEHVSLLSVTAPVRFMVVRGGDFSAITDWFEDNPDSSVEGAAYFTDPMDPLTQAPILYTGSGTVVYNTVVETGVVRDIDLTAVFIDQFGAVAQGLPTYAYVVQSLGVDTVVHASAVWNEIQ